MVDVPFPRPMGPFGNLKDMGDGTHAEVVSSALGSTDSTALAMIGTPQTSSDLTTVVSAIVTATTTAIVAAVAAQTTRVHRMRMNVAGANVVTIKDGTTTLEVLNFTAAAFLTYDFSARPWYKTTANTALNITTSTTAALNVVTEYITSA